MRVVFMGTPDFAVPTLEALIAVSYTHLDVYKRQHLQTARA